MDGALRDILVTTIAWERFTGRLTSVAPGRWWTIETDGTIRLAAGPPPPGVAVGNGAATDALVALGGPEIAWLSTDSFYSGVFRPMARTLRSSERLAWVQSAAAGTDAGVFRDLLARGVRITTAHVTAIPIAEYVLGAVLRHYQRPEAWEEAARAHEWRHHDFREVHGTTWLVVGLGAIGTEVATRARAFGARVLGVRRTPTGDEPVDAVYTPDRWREALPAADVVVLAAPATSETHHLIDRTALAAMRAGSVLVNVARGSLVDEDALLAALDRGRPAHAVLDVVATEPLPADSPLWDHPAVTLTAHSAGGGLGRDGRAADVFTDNLGRYLAGEPLVHEVAPDQQDAVGAGWRQERP
ncbi:MAG TPA: D-2-hydroxyacid dehydrogenase [Acidimicrobiales bacterium]